MGLERVAQTPSLVTTKSALTSRAVGSVADPRHFDSDLNPIFHFVADLDPDPSFQIKAQDHEKVLK
jgi:hypothetical protein